jgi:hypothetical protein
LWEFGVDIDIALVYVTTRREKITFPRSFA